MIIYNIYNTNNTTHLKDIITPSIYIKPYRVIIAVTNIVIVMKRFCLLTVHIQIQMAGQRLYVALAYILYITT